MASKLSEKSKRNFYSIVLGFLCFTLVCMLTNFLGFYKQFIIGSFGLVAYPIVLLLICFCILKLMHKTFSLDTKSFAYCIAILVVVLAMFQMGFTRNYDFSSFGAYLGQVYHSTTTPAGVVLGVLVFPIRYLLHEFAVYVVFAIVLVILIACAIDNYYFKMSKIMRAKQSHSISASKKAIIDVQKAMEENKAQTVYEQEIEDVDLLEDEEKQTSVQDEQSQKAKEILGLATRKEDEEVMEDKQDAYNVLYGDATTRKRAISTLYPDKQNLYQGTASDEYLSSNLEKYMPDDRKPAKRSIDIDSRPVMSSTKREQEEKASIEYLNRTIPKNTHAGTLIRGDYYGDGEDSVEIVGGQDSEVAYDNFEDLAEHDDFDFDTFEKNNDLDTMDEEEDLQEVLNQGQEYDEEEVVLDREPFDTSLITERLVSDHNIFAGDERAAIEAEHAETGGEAEDEVEQEIVEENVVEREVKEEEHKVEHVVEKPQPPKHKKHKKYSRPPINLLQVESTDLSSVKADTITKTQVLEEILASFKIPAKVNDVVVGPSVTMYELTMPIGISVKSINRYQDDIAMALEAKSGIRIQAPIPGKNAVGIEVPNDKPSTVGFREAFETGAFNKQSNKPLSFVLGKDLFGEYQFCDIAKAPHMLIAGSTGSGKSVCLNIMLLSLLYKNSPDDVKLILIDPKKVEFAIYEGIPHLMLPSVITEPEKAVGALNWAVNEMEHRYRLLQQVKLRDIGEYNTSEEVKNGERDKLPYIIIVVDELADLMAVVKREIEEKIQRLAAKARSAGIHLVLATQRPSIDVVTGTIKNNLPVRIAFRVASYTDSKTVIDAAGAEKLLGRGDMLYCASGSNPKRIQSPFVDTPEVKDIVEFIKENNEPDFDENLENIMFESQENQKEQASKPVVGPRNVAETDDQFVYALKIVVETRQASASMLQRRLRLGWNRAGSLIDAMQKMNYISEPINNKRQVLISMEQFKEIYGEVEDR